jgi:hypothetical protein
MEGLFVLRRYPHGLTCTRDRNGSGDTLDVIVELDAVFHLLEEIRQQFFALNERLLADLGPAELQCTLRTR